MARFFRVRTIALILVLAISGYGIGGINTALGGAAIGMLLAGLLANRGTECQSRGGRASDLSGLAQRDSRSTGDNPSDDQPNGSAFNAAAATVAFLLTAVITGVIGFFCLLSRHMFDFSGDLSFSDDVRLLVAGVLFISVFVATAAGLMFGK